MRAISHQCHKMRATKEELKEEGGETYYHFSAFYFRTYSLICTHTVWKINIKCEKRRQAHENTKPGIVKEKSTRLMTRQTMRTMSMLMLSEMGKRKKMKKVRENKLEAVAAWGKMEKSFWPSSSSFIAILWHTYHSANEQKFHRNVEKIKFYPNLFIYGTYRTKHEVRRALLSIFHLPSRKLK